MAKKTNALIFRYGVESFWKNQNVGQHFGLGVAQLENIIYKTLSMKGLSVLAAYYRQASINIFVFSRVVKIKKLNVITSKLLYFWFFFFSLQLFSYFWIELESLKYCTKAILPRAILSKLYTCFYFNRKIPVQHALSSCPGFKLRKQVRSYLKLQLQSSSLSYILFSLSKKTCKIFLTNIFFTQGFFFRVSVDKNNPWLTKARGLIYSIFLAVEYKSSRLLAQQLATMLARGKQHYQQLKSTVLLIKKYYMSNRINFLGLRVDVSGKLAGRMRKRKYRKSLGKLPLQTVKVMVSYCLALSYTKFGILSVKIWIVNARY